MNILVIGGGTKGNIGYGIAKKFCDEGHDVIVADIHFEEGFDDDIEVEGYYLDVTDELQVKRLMQTIGEHMGGNLDVVINSAGVNILGKIEEYRVENFKKTLDVNLTSQFLLLQNYVNNFDNNGHKKTFLAITSDTGIIPKTSTFAYGASKAGANHFIRCTARELNKYHEDDWVVTALAIGRVLTPMDAKTIKDVAKQRQIPECEAEKMLSYNIPTSRGMTIEEVAEWAYFLSTKGDYATGNIIRVDSGQCQG